MTKGPLTNVAASVHQRLLNLAKKSNRGFSDLLQYYALERWLYRLSRSDYSERLILKGRIAVVCMAGAPLTRPTRDIDLLGRLSNDLDSIRAVISGISVIPVEDDGLVFDPATVITERIAVDADYHGVRAKFRGHLENARIAMQIDIGFSDVMTPGPVHMTYPTILQQSAPRLLAYNRETAVAEKFEAMVKLGELNTRIKDFFDIWLLAAHFAFGGRTLTAAVGATFNRRQTAIETAPICFSERFASDPSKAIQWKAFVKRAILADAPESFSQVMERVREFLQPVAMAIAEGRELNEKWSPGGRW